MTEQMIVEAIQSAQERPRILPNSVSAPIADPNLVEKFQAAIAPSTVQPIPFADQISTTWQSVQNNHQGIIHRIQALTEMSASYTLSASELSKLQYEVSNLSFQQEVVAKVADKASSAIQTLIRNQ